MNACPVAASRTARLEPVTSGTANLTLTSMLPYAHWRPRAGLEVWGLAGVGLGDAALQDEAGKVETDLLMWLAAGGVRQQVATWAWKAGADGCGSTK